MPKSIARDDAAAFVCDLLQSKPKMRREDLSARNVAKALGQTTGFLYHHWGSFDDFLFEVSGLGWGRLVESVEKAYAKSGEASSIVRAYVAFAAKNPVLYWLIAERELPADVVKKTLTKGIALPSYTAWVRFFELVSKADPGVTLAKARAMHAAAHGLASQLLSGRISSMPDAVQRSAAAISADVEDAITAGMIGASAPARHKTTSRSPKASRR